MNFIDLLAAIAVGWGVWKGLTRGFILEVIGLVSFVVAIWAGLRLAFLFTDYYKENTQVPGNFVPFLAFLTAFGLAVVALWLVGRILSKTAEDGLELTLPNRVLGALFGGLKWAFILGSALSVAGHSEILVPKSVQEGSATYPYITGLCRGVNEYSVNLLPYARNVFKDMEDYFHDLDSLRHAGTATPPAPVTP